MEYKDTIFLPKTSFEMRANLPNKEPKILDEWNKEEIFNKLRKNDYNVNELVSSKKNKIKYYFYHERSALNTVDSYLVKKRKAKPNKIIYRETNTLNSIIENSPYKKSKINLIAIILL